MLRGRGLVHFGIGTTGCSGMIGIGANVAPRIATPGFRVSCTNTPAQSPGTLALADQAVLLGSDPLGLGLLLHVNLLSPFFGTLAMPSDAGGTGSTPIPLPGEPTLVGARIGAQSLRLENPAAGRLCSGALAHLVSSRGLRFRILP